MKNYDSRVVNGEILRQMIISGSNNLFNQYPEVDALNVFPVPDGDTGTNMNLTMTSGAKEVMNIRNDNIYEVSKMFSKGLLMGARGNSGVILSQIFRGFAQSLEGKQEIDVAEFAQAWKKGAEVAYRAVMKPVEGTILTVIRESSSALIDNVEEIDTIGSAMTFLLENARVSLAHTPELLPVLKEVGVIDSGGAGLVKIFEGMLSGLSGEIIERRQITMSHNEKDIKTAATDMKSEESGYSVDFVLRLSDSLEKKKFNQNRFIKIFEGIGNSLTLDKKEELLKVHVNTLKPGVVLNLAQAYGEFVNMKIENMQEPHSEEQFGVEEPETERKEYAIIATSVGEGLNNLFASLNADYIVSGGQTMNPSTDDFLEAIKKVHAKKVFILPNNKNIIMTAGQACEVAENCECRVIPSKTILQGMVACMMFNPANDFTSNEEDMREAITSVKSGQVTFSIKDTKIDGVNIKKDEFMGIYDSHIVCCEKNKHDSAKALVHLMVDKESSIVTIIYGSDVTEEEALKLGKYIENKYNLEVEIHNGGQPVYSYFIGVE